jgi:hypothetical protein
MRTAPAAFDLPAVGLTLSMAEIYEAIAFDGETRLPDERPTSRPRKR